MSKLYKNNNKNKINTDILNNKGKSLIITSC